MLRAVRAIYKQGQFVFPDSSSVPKEGAEVMITFLDEENTTMSGLEAIQALKGRGRDEHLVEKLLQSRREDREQDERSYRLLRS